MHDRIQSFTLNGTTLEHNILQVRERLIAEQENSMRVQGYVPVLDLDPQFTVDYKGDGVFEFHLTVYGAKVKGDAWQIAGLMSGKLLQKHTTPTK